MIQRASGIGWVLLADFSVDSERPTKADGLSWIRRARPLLVGSLIALSSRPKPIQ